MNPTVDLVVNTFERNYRKVLAPGFFPDIEKQCCRKFSRRIVLINNVDDIDDATELAASRVHEGDLCDYFLVADYLDKALETVSLKMFDLGRIHYFSDYAFVAMYLAQSDFLLYWDADVYLTECCDWVSPGAELLMADQDVLVVNPQMDHTEMAREVKAQKEGFSFGFGFSDQLFLADPVKLKSAHTTSFCPISLRYPLAHIKPIFEERVDRFMRRNGLLRATYLRGAYYHPVEQGESYPALTRWEQLLKLRNRFITGILRRAPFKSPLLSI